MSNAQKIKLSVILPTRGRTKSLEISLKSLLNRANDPKSIELMLSFDLDDYLGLNYFNENLKQYIIEKGCQLKILINERLGYHRLNEYCNMMALISQGDWIMMWNDDAINHTVNWDKMITDYTGQFKVLSVITHNEHPNSIFPIVPKQYVQILGFFSRHKECDNEISQIGYLLDIFERIPFYVTHDRADITGNNNDDTYKERLPDPHFQFDITGSFHHPDVRNQRYHDVERLATFMRSWGLDTSWWDSILQQKNSDPWKKMKLNDTNHQIDEINIATNESVRHQTHE